MVDPNFPHDVRQFHEAAELPCGGPPRNLEGSADLARMLYGISVAETAAIQGSGELALRLRVILEELREYVDAVAAGDLVGQLDALVDILYVVVGAGVQQGMPLNQAWDEVHRTNMAKVVGGVLKDNMGKVQKPEGWEPPDLASILATAMAKAVGDGVFTTATTADGEVLDVEIVSEEEIEDGSEESATVSQDREDPESGGEEGGAEEEEGHGGGGSPGGSGLFGKW